MLNTTRGKYHLSNPSGRWPHWTSIESLICLNGPPFTLYFGNCHNGPRLSNYFANLFTHFSSLNQANKACITIVQGCKSFIRNCSTPCRIESSISNGNSPIHPWIIRFLFIKDCNCWSFWMWSMSHARVRTMNTIRCR